MATYHQEGQTIDFTAAADVDAGQIVAVGTLKGIAVSDVLDGEKGALRIEGVIRVECVETDVGMFVKLRTTEQDAVEADEGDRYDGMIVGVYETGIALVKLAQGEVDADTVSGS